MLDLNNYIILYENGDIIFYNNYEIIRLLQNNAKLISYNKDTSIFLIIAHDYLYILKENNNFEILKEIKKFPIKEIISEEEKFNLIFCENIFNYVILYTIENNPKPEKDDRLYFIKLNENMEEIINIYQEENFFTPDDYYLSGISYYSQLKRTIFSLYDEDLGIYMIFNKHMDKLNKYYYFESNQDNKKIYDIYEIQISDEYQINGLISKSDDNENKGKYDEIIENEEDDCMNNIKENNAIIGVTLIKFKFDGYDDENEMVEKEMIKSPYLIFLLGFYGGFKIFYASSFNQKSLKEKSESFSKLKNISNKVLEISINEEMTKIEREKYLNENIKKEKNFTELNKLKKLNQRNIFLHELDQQIKDNLEYFKSLAISNKIEFQLRELDKLADNPNIKTIQESIKNLMNEAKELFIEDEENQKFIEDNKNMNEIIKNEEINIKNSIKKIEDNKNKTKGLKMNINTPINELLTHPKIKNFFKEEKVINMMNIFNKIKKYYDLYENHVHLISELFIINNDLIKQIEECRKKYNSIQDSCKYSQNWKEINGMKAKLQNNIFILYMRVFEQFFCNLEKYENNNLKNEYLYLTQLKNYLEPVKKLKNEEEDKEKGKIHRNHARFDLRDEEEDIDEGNNNSISSEELEKNIISTSSLKKNKIIEFNNYNRINNNNEIEQQLVIAKNDKNAFINNNNNKDYLVNKEERDTINKIFGVNLVKEKEASKKNYLIDVLSNFEGRITIYNKETEKNYCTDAEELFQEFLLNEEEIEKKKLKDKQTKERKEKKKKDILQEFEDSVRKTNEEKEKIKKELSLIQDKNKTEILEKEKQNKILIQKLEEMEKKFNENEKEREKERKSFMDEIQKNKDDEKQKLINEQKDANTKIKTLEEEIKNYKEKLKEEEKKRIEAEEKNKKFEGERGGKININIDSNNNNKNISLNGDNEQQKKEEEDKNKNKNNIPLFTSNIPNPTGNNIFTQPQKSEDTSNKRNQPSIFDSITDIKSEPKPTSDINQQNLFTSSSQGNPRNIFRTDAPKNNNIFGFNNALNNLSSLPQNNIFKNINSNNDRPQNAQSQNNQPQNIQSQTQNKPNNFLASLNINNQNNVNETNSLFKNLNIGPTNQDNNSQSIFGQHSGFGYQQNNKNNNEKKIEFLQFNSTSTTNNNSPFVGLGNPGNNLFNNNQAQNNNNDNNKNEFF